MAIQGDYINTLLLSPDAVISVAIGLATPVLRHLEGTVRVQNSGLDWILFSWIIKFGPTHVFHLCISPCMPSFRCLEWLQRMAADERSQTWTQNSWHSRLACRHQLCCTSTSTTTIYVESLCTYSHMRIMLQKYQQGLEWRKSDFGWFIPQPTFQSHMGTLSRHWMVCSLLFTFSAVGIRQSENEIWALS